MYKRKHEKLRILPKIVKEKPKKKLKSISKLEKELDAVFSKYIRLRDAIDSTGWKENLVCFTCDKLIPIKKAQNMHFISRRYKALRWSESNCFWGCVACNVMLHGNYIEYTLRMQKNFWTKFVNDLIEESKKIYKVTRQELEEKLALYTQKLNDLK